MLSKELQAIQGKMPSAAVIDDAILEKGLTVKGLLNRVS